MFVLSVLGLALNCLLVGLLVDILIDTRMDIIGVLLAVGSAAACLLAGTMHYIVSLARRPNADGGAA